MRLKGSRRFAGILLPILLIVGSFLIAPSAHAWATDVAAGILSVVISGLGLILILVVQGLIAIASYQHFIDSEAVILGWVLVRDLCNMFFVVILLIIAFGTILNIPNYSYKKWLPKLILFAILINFSKTICGLLIDVAQVIMLTFVNAFITIGGANFVDILGIRDIVTMSDAGDVGFWTVVGAYMLGIIYMLVATVVLVTMIMILAMRLVMIWIYVVLSPLAYLMSAFPGGQKYASQWWSEFSKNLIVGPVLAFFIWLSLAALGSDKNLEALNPTIDSDADKIGTGSIKTTGSPTGTKAGTPGALIKFVIAIGMLVGGLMVSQQIGGAAGSMAGKGMASLQKGAKLGLAGVGAVTGYRYASGVMKKYSDMRKQKREAGYSAGAAKLADNIGKVKKGSSDLVMKGVGVVKDYTWGRAGAKAKKLSQEASDLREKSKDTQYKFEKKEKVGNWEWDDHNNLWSRKRGNTTEFKDNKEMQSIISRGGSIANAQADRKEKEAQELRQDQALYDKMAKYGMMAAGGVVAAATGGLGGLAIASVVPKIAKGVKNAGQTDLDIASGFRVSAVSEAREKTKHESDDQVIAMMDDSSQSAFTRMAAALESMDRGLLSLNQVKLKKEEIKNSMGGADSQGGWKDKKMGSYVENIIAKKYVGASKDFENLDSKDQKVKDKAERTVSEKFKSGTYSLDSLDEGSLKRSMDILSHSLSTRDFVRQFDGLKDALKKASIIKGLKSVDSFEAKEKLFRVSDLKTAFGNDQAGKEQALGNLKYKDIDDVTDSTEKTQAIVEAIQASSKPQQNRIDLFVNAKLDLQGGSPKNVDLRRKLQI